VCWCCSDIKLTKAKHKNYSNISDINNPNKDVKLSFHAIVATVNGTVHRSAFRFFTAIVTADSLYVNDSFNQPYLRFISTDRSA
jgi:hypothetical protein